MERPISAFEGSWPECVCSPRSTAYCSASQYTVTVTKTVASRATVLSALPPAARTAAVMIVP